MTEEETTKYAGGCACGQVRYSAEGRVFYMGNCHCRDCQRATGSAYFPAFVIAEAGFELLQGEPKWHEVTAEKGHPMQRGFCPDCGSPLFLKNGASPKTRALFAGSLDDPGQYEPSRNIYVSSAHAWDVMDPALPQDEKMPSW